MKILNFIRAVCLMILVFPFFAYGESEDRNPGVVYWNRNFDNPASFAFLDLALKKTEDLFGKASILRSNEVTQGRAVMELENGKGNPIKIINIVPDSDRLARLTAIPIAIEGGLIGFRVCIIKEAKRALFEGIRSYQDLLDEHITFGQGVHWPDVDVLRGNGLEVVTGVQFADLFEMLKRDRFDCFLRGAHEVEADFLAYADDTMVIEPGIVFTYPSSSLFFVNQGDFDLAARIELGLRRSIMDGSYGKLFNKLYTESLNKLKIDDRLVIRLSNPLANHRIMKKTAAKFGPADGKINRF